MFTFNKNREREAVWRKIIPEAVLKQLNKRNSQSIASSPKYTEASKSKKHSMVTTPADQSPELSSHRASEASFHPALLLNTPDEQMSSMR